MFLSTVELGSISKSMRLSYTLIIEEDLNMQNAVKEIKNTKVPLISHRINMVGNEVLKVVTSKGYVTLDINRTNDTRYEWSSLLRVNMGRLNLFRLLQGLKRIVDNFKVKELYYYKSNLLYLNHQVAKNFEETIDVGSRVVKMMYSVVPDPEAPTVSYEGIAFCINDYSNFCLLTYEETLYLYYRLKQLNFDLLALETINIYLMSTLLESKDKKELEEPEIIISEEVSEDTMNGGWVKEPEPPTIPDI